MLFLGIKIALKPGEAAGSCGPHLPMLYHEGIVEKWGSGGNKRCRRDGWGL